MPVGTVMATLLEAGETAENKLAGRRKPAAARDARASTARAA